MTPEAQRIAIAEACGWRFEHKNKGSSYWVESIAVYRPNGVEPCGWWSPVPPKFKSGKRLEEHRQQIVHGLSKAGAPDYLNDLNAMHEAENALDREAKESFGNLLTEKVFGVRPEDVDVVPNGYGRFRMYHATAAQRAEAFLRTLSLWDDAK